MAGINIVAKSVNGPDNLFNGTSSDAKGNWEILQLKKGGYLFTFTAIGYQKKDSLIVVDSKDIFLSISLEEAVENINEIVVKADFIQLLGNKEQIFFSENEKSKARSGIELMQSVPQISLNRSSNSLTTIEGKPILILLDGQKVDGIDLMSISPNDIAKAEYYATTPARYANMGVEAVLAITSKRNKEKGGYLMANLENGFASGYGTDILSGKYSTGNNDFSLRYFIDYRNLDKNRQDQTYAADLEDGEYRVEKEGLNSMYKGEFHKIEGNYSFVRSENLLFSVKPKVVINPGKEDANQRITYGKEDQSMFYTNAKTNSFSPSVDLYFSKKMAKEQEFILNVVNTWYDTNSDRNVMESNNQSVVYENNTEIETKTYSIISEMVYLKKIRSNEITVGLKHQYKMMDERYTNTSAFSESESSIQNFYGYVDFSGEAGKWYYSAGIGGENTRIRTESDKQYFVVKPNLSISYKLNSKNQIQLYSRINSSVPGMSMLSTSVAYIDSLFISYGNSDLKPYYSSSNMLAYTFRNSSVYVRQAFSFFYFHQPYHVMFFNSGKFIEKTYQPIDYSTSFKYLSSFRWTPTKWFSLSPSYGVEYQTSKSDDEKRHNWYHVLNISASVSYQNFSLTPQIYIQSKSLEGELLRRENNFYGLELSWNKDKLNIGLGSMFMNSPHTLETLGGSSVYYQEKKTWNDFKALTYATLTYTLPFGKSIQRKIKQQITHTDNDSGVYQDNKAKQ